MEKVKTRKRYKGKKLYRTKKGGFKGAGVEPEAPPTDE